MNARMPLDAAANRASAPLETDIAIIGTGFAGLGMAIRLRQAGLTDFIVAEKADSVGGTWRDNHYPGCACDVQSHVYSFSFAPNPRWTRMFARQPEIRAYLEDCARRFGVQSHLRFAHELASAVYDDARHRWHLKFANGQQWSARVLISAMGGLSRAALPDIPGIDTFKGRAFHSQHWDHAYALDGKRVAVIGTGASAIQFVPQIAPRVAHLTLFQRTPPWIMPKADRAVRPYEQWLFRHLPFTQKIMRSALYCMLESRALGFAIHPSLMKTAQKAAERHLRRQVRDPQLRATLTPDYTMGCKRVLISNDYYPALTRANVEVTTSSIARIEDDAVITSDGVRHPADCLIFGTGFQVADPFPRGVVLGRGGVDIVDTWRDGAHAYLGTTLPGYPNFFMIVGPNTGLGHNSMVFMIESQVEYILRALKTMQSQRAEAIEVRPQVEHAYNQQIQQKLGRAIWSTGGCKSWYLDPRTGKNTTLWPGFAYRFRQATSTFSMDDYFAYSPAPQVATTQAAAPHSARVHGNAAAAESASAEAN
ncbi:NAD(P)/FAD-dependent oxidoreductase [bacterium M00.F.Ca.ET.228.01.1.1]|uniref:flavin-containing monooxygenase n=1 Tax=Paraburkholderia phenoliruptrix TaxID=252970 RepID=UPI001092333C|nr:NAD(P)/FAD-dependent oxidoreductase [Paraburkholderia phenoliruptrix]TGP40697.1 NAD(P)/FAD-dependent oxidoreductase [bacterium M00.F.Ca.ET.228.01.1.1]TGR96948.1 NAD(P)/FAD-dependent oxidoreductase [bacterium M00.F.Ca.ET.191.01.1.1]TGT98258.1 NAD(P)/FAD-dependent oxidoreductase [bacterium M00.F.Ca.ET.155.01.1.1]MBW0448195.1 NAD(P)/FAD-dependent oxidoreductase [Paraburkholderia phenoliruptrix]MBW9100302.1 NAD(P)/FAD-dependent oxidoreductase [Paraburkholderia phenoliruptrix]